MPDQVEIEAIHAAARILAVSGTVLRSPLVQSASLSQHASAEVFLKLENLQPIGAFKIRGATYALSRLTEAEARRGVVCCSTGNHGRAMAFAAKARGIPATVCLSSLVPEVKVAAVAALGARVVRYGSSQDEAQIKADQLAAEEGLVALPPFDHPDIIAGQGTIGLELLQDRPDLHSVLVPLSGGGLLAGIAVAIKALNPAVRVIGISMERGAAMATSLRNGAPTEVPELPTLADSLGGGIGRHNRHSFDLCRKCVDEVILLSEAEIYQGMRWMLLRERIVTEGAAAVGAAAILAGKFKPKGPTAIVISGQNVDMTQLLSIARGEPVRLGDITVENSQ